MVVERFGEGKIKVDVVERKMEHTLIIENLEEVIEPAFPGNNIPLCLFSSDDYAPYCGVLLQSVIENSTSCNNYDIVILERSISDNNKRLMLNLIKGRINFSIRFLNVTNLSKLLLTETHGHFVLEGCIKIFLLSNLFSKYDKFVATDSDLVFNRDLAELYATDVKNYYMAAVDDVIMKSLVADKHMSGARGKAPEMPAGEYITDYLGMEGGSVYFNTGVVVFNLKGCRENNIFEKVYKKLNNKYYWFLEQDALNEVCWEHTVKLSLKWNVLSGNNGLERIKQVLSQEQYVELMDSLDDYYIMHFAGNHKPWNEPSLAYSERFFKVARKSPWYEQIIFKMSGQYSIRVARDTGLKLYKTSNTTKKPLTVREIVKKIPMFIPNLFLPKGSARRELVKQIYYRSKDKELMRERHKMLMRVRKMYWDRCIKGSEFYSNYWRLKSLKDSHKDERCFIIGNGPSLVTADLEKLENEITFGMNSIYKLFETTSWRPTFYVSNDVMLNYMMKVPVESRKRDLLECIENYRFKCCFISSSDYNSELKEKCKSELLFLPTEDYLYQLKQPRFPKFHDDCSRRCQAFGTTAYLIYQIAVYMGFSEIYFLGTDCSYTGGKIHAYIDTKEEVSLYADKRWAYLLEVALLRGFAAINEHCSSNTSVTVYNATRGGKLELFPRVNLDEIL